MTAGEAATCVASMFVDTGGAKFVAIDLFVELSIASVKRLIGKQRGKLDVDHMAKLPCVAGVLESLRDSDAGRRFLGDKTRGRNNGVKSKFQEILSKARDIVARRQLDLFSSAPHVNSSTSPRAPPRGFETADLSNGACRSDNAVSSTHRERWRTAAAGEEGAKTRIGRRRQRRRR